MHSFSRGGTGINRWISHPHTLQLLQARDFGVLADEPAHVTLKLLRRVPCMGGEGIAVRLEAGLVPVVAQEGWQHGQGVGELWRPLSSVRAAVVPPQ